MNNILITICARVVPKVYQVKTLSFLNGIPLIGYSINVAKQVQSKYKNATISLYRFSWIANIAEKLGLPTIINAPNICANDTVGKIDAIRDILNIYENKEHLKYDYILDLDVTSPLRNIYDIENAFNVIEADSDAVNLFSVSEASRSPYFNMVEKKENGYYAQVKK